MTFYDDAELVAVEAVRLAAAENETGVPRSADIHELTVRLFEQHGPDGITALVVAFARSCANAFLVLARQQQVTVEQFIDNWEMHKLTAHYEDEE